MVQRKQLAPNNRQNIPLQQLLGVQLAPYRYPKSNETTSIKTYDRPGKGVEGESVNK